MRNGPAISRQNFGTVLGSLCRKDQEALSAEAVCFCAYLVHVCIKFAVTTSACRFKVVGWLVKKYKTPREAEATYFGYPSSSHCAAQSTSGQSSAEPSGVSSVVHLFKQLPLETQLQTLSTLFSSYVSSKYSISVPDDYLEYSAMAMANLRHNACSNVLYNLAKGMGTPRADGSDSRFPVKRMPMGLIEYAASFFACDNLQSVSTRIAILCLHNVLATFADSMSIRLSFVATVNVLSFWPEVG